MSKKAETLIEEKIVAWIESVGGKTVKLHGSPYLEKGTPDRLVSMYIYDKTRKLRIPLHFLLEVKTDSGVISKTQELRIKEWDASGMLTVIARSVEDVQQVLFMLASLYEPVSSYNLRNWYEI